MSAANKDATLDLIFGVEKGYTNHPEDPGGPTNWGVTQATLAAYRHKPVTIADVKALTREEALRILCSGYLDPIRFGDLPAGLDYATADFSTNSGPAQATKTLQRLVGVTADGIMGPKTIDAIMKRDLPGLIQDYCAARLAFMKTHTHWKDFGRGWTIRVTGIDPKGEWNPQPGVVGHALDMAHSVQLPTAATVIPAEGQAKANPADKKLTASLPAMTNLGTSATAIAAATATIVSAVKPQLDPVAHLPGVQTVLLGLTIAGAVAGVVIAVSRIKRGEAVA